MCGCLIGQALAEGWEAVAAGLQDRTAGKWRAYHCLGLELHCAACTSLLKLLESALADSEQLQDLTLVGQCPLHCPLSRGSKQIPAHHL